MIWYDIEYMIYIYINIGDIDIPTMVLWDMGGYWYMVVTNKRLGYAIRYGICHGNIVQGGVDRDVETDVNVGYYWCINVDVVQLGHENGD